MKKLLKITATVLSIGGIALGMTSCGTPKAGDSKYLVVGTNAYFPPFEYYEGDALSGIDMELASKIAEKVGKELYVSDMEFDSLIPSVTSDDIDLAMAGMTVNEERKKTVDFCDEYYTSAQVITVKSGDTTFDGCTTAADIEAKLKTLTTSYVIGTQNGTTGYMYSAGDEGFGYDGFTNVTTKGYTTGALAMQDLANGKVNAVILDKQPSLMITKDKSEYKVYSDEAFELTAEAYAFAIKKGNTELKDTVNDLLKSMKDNGSLETLIDSYFNGTATFTHTNK